MKAYDVKNLGFSRLFSAFRLPRKSDGNLSRQTRRCLRLLTFVDGNGGEGPAFAAPRAPPPSYFFIAASITECVQAPSGFLVMTGSDLPPRRVATVRS